MDVVSMHARAGGPAAGSPTRNITGPGGSSLWTCSTNSPRSGLWPAVLVADTGYGANADFRHALEDRGLPGQGRMTAHTETAEPYEPPYGGLGPRPLPRYRTRRSACVNSTGRGSPLPLSPVPPASPRGTSRTEPWNSTWAAKTSRARHARGRPQRR
ncbi:transposase [Streptomyces sp. NBC_00353]|uniref:transposase n=1 Tax=Streptomyces sp. NBC_00353 TaxID=2975722 RepID=UPI003FA6FB83